MFISQLYNNHATGGQQECKSTRSGQYYAGTVHVTLSNKPCQAWNSNSPHSNPYVSSTAFADGNSLNAQNFCRNPTWSTYTEGVWCFTTDPDVPWELCDVPMCGMSITHDSI